MGAAPAPSAPAPSTADTNLADMRAGYRGTSRSAMRTFTSTLLFIIALPAAAARSDPPPIRYVNTRQVLLTVNPADEQPIDRARLWFSTDEFQTWQDAANRPLENCTLTFEATKDGKYLFYIVLENEAGRSAPPPTPGSEPHLAVVVDTALPTIQIHQAQAAASDAGREIRLDVSLIEENLGPAGLRVFYRTGPQAPWQDGGSAACIDGEITWHPPQEINPEVDIRVVATDLAGNQAFDAIHRVPTTPATAATATGPTKPGPAIRPPATTTAPGEPPPARVVVEPVKPVTVAPVDPISLDEPASEPPASKPKPPPAPNQQAERLRTLAKRYLAQGRFSLAGARLQDALKLLPNDPNLQVDLGSVLYRARQYDQADRLFQHALAAAPDHLGAIEGLALVAATKNRYSHARAHLQRLLRLDPESGRHWLYYGDIEHKLGNAAEAHAAWEKALQLEPSDTTIREKVGRRLELFGRESAVSD
jgi:hypothetical protein